MRAKLALAVALLGGVLAPASLAQEEQRHPASGANTAGEERKSEEGDKWLVWKWANFAILAAAVGYLVVKNAGPFFQARSEEIQRGIADAAAARREAESRAAAIEARLSALSQDIEKLRASGQAELAAESGRIQRETELHLRKLQQQTEQEIEALIKGMRQELRNFSGALAIELAERKLRERINPEAQRQLVGNFAAELREGKLDKGVAA